MGMRLEGLSPGVQDGEKADPSAEMLRIGCDFQERGRAGFEQQSKEPPLVLPHQRHERMRHAEDQVIVATGSSSCCRLRSHWSRALVWHLGQCRLRHEL